MVNEALVQNSLNMELKPTWINKNRILKTFKRERYPTEEKEKIYIKHKKKREGSEKYRGIISTFSVIIYEYVLESPSIS